MDPWHPVQQAGEDKPHLCAHTTDRWCLFVHEDMAVERSGWLWGHGCGTGVGPRAEQSPEAVWPPARRNVPAQPGREWVGGGSWDSFQDLTWQPFPAGRAWLAPFFPSILLRSCIPA